LKRSFAAEDTASSSRHFLPGQAILEPQLPTSSARSTTVRVSQVASSDRSLLKTPPAHRDIFYRPDHP
jgi:hypothetical protein